MPERKRIVRFEIVFSCIPFLLRLSQIVEPEPEPHPRPSRIRLKTTYGFRMFYLSAVSPTNAGFQKWMTGELQRQNGNCSRAENAVDFRERDSRSIWRSELRRSCCRILLAGAGAGVLFVGEVPLSFRF